MMRQATDERKKGTQALAVLTAIEALLLRMVQVGKTG
jgi:hypothetical protein